MTEKMQNLLAKECELHNKIEALMAADKMGTQEATDALKEAEENKRSIQNLERAEKLDKSADTNIEVPHNTKKNGYQVVARAIKENKFLDAAETPLKTGGLNGESYLLPEDIKLDINKYKQEQLSAKELVTVIPTAALSGSFNWGKNPTDGIINFTDGDAVDSSGLPEFVRETWTASWKGAAIPVTTILQGAEKAGLMPFINYWFSRRVVIKENSDIFAAFKANYNGGSPKVLANEKALRKSINTDLDPAYTSGENMTIVTNQTGFDFLDQLKDTNGRDLLQPDLTKPTRKLYKGIAIKVFSDAQLPNIIDNTTKKATHAPIIYGDTKSALWFMSYEDYLFDTDNGKGAGFLKNTTYLKLIEAYAICKADTNGYVYGSLALA